jgi:hypothetical protein
MKTGVRCVDCGMLIAHSSGPRCALCRAAHKTRSSCASECDCGTINGHPHEPDCHWWDKCDEGRSCDKHWNEAAAEHEYLRHVPRHQVINDEQSREEFNQELRDAGRGHLVRP